jgi:hypothetical protein
MMTLMELQAVRERLAEEVEFFDDVKTTERQKSQRLLFLFMKDLMDGLNGGCDNMW